MSVLNHNGGSLALLAMAKLCTTNGVSIKLSLKPSTIVPSLRIDSNTFINESLLICRYLARKVSRYGGDPIQQTQVDFFVDLAGKLVDQKTLPSFCSTINKHLATRSYLVGQDTTLADYVVLESLREKKGCVQSEHTHISRWLNVMESLPEVLEALPLLTNTTVANKAKDVKVQKTEEKAAPTSKEQAESNNNNLPPTVPDYFKGSYLFEGVANILAATDTEIILDRTIFHPQGGGQPTDIGIITNGTSTFSVNAVSKQGDVIVHKGEWQTPFDKTVIGQQVQCKIDEENRRLCARLHSAGHLIDVAMNQIGFDFPATKGYHFPAGSYVEYIGSLKPEEKEPALVKLQEACDRLCQSGVSMDVKLVPYNEAGKFYDGNIPDFLPKGQPVRTVGFEGSTKQDCPCGGTHVENSADIEQVIVRKFVKKKKVLRVCYDVKRSE